MKHRVILFIALIPLYIFNINSQTQIGSDIDGLNPGDTFGTDVSISSDGTIVAGTAYGTPYEEGRLRVFKNTGGVWSLYGTDINGENFGGMISYCVSLSDNGHTLAASGFGNVKIFGFNTNTGIWMPKGNDIINTTSLPQFGYSVKLSADGNSIVIGSVNAPIVPIVGVTQVFEFENDNWNQVGNDIDGLVAAEHSGRSVDVSSGGKTVSISNNNSIRVYKYVSGNWILLGDEIVATGSQSANRRVSLSSNGNILVIGEPDFTDTLIQRGRVRVFSYESNSWSQVGSEILGDVAYYRTGRSVSLSSDGDVLAIGEMGSTSGSTDKGRTRIFENQSGSWIQVGNDIFGEASLDYSGSSVSLSGDASTVAIGASLNDGNGVDSGHIRVYDLSPTLSVIDLNQSKIELFPNPVNEQFTIQLQKGNKLEKARIYNTLGERVITTNSLIINTSELSSGTYFVEIKTAKGSVSKKIIVN